MVNHSDSKVIIDLIRLNFVAINAHILAEIPDLIRERYFKRVKCIAGVLNQLGCQNRGSLHRRVYAGAHSRNSLKRTIAAGADDGKRRVVKIMDCGGFAHEFGTHADTEVFFHDQGNISQAVALPNRLQPSSLNT